MRVDAVFNAVMAVIGQGWMNYKVALEFIASKGLIEEFDEYRKKRGLNGKV